MKHICVAAIITSGGIHSNHILLGRRGKDPNRGLYVLPGGHVEDNESLEGALSREIVEETGLEIVERTDRWYRPDIIELPDRIILVTKAYIRCRIFQADTNNFIRLNDDKPRDGSDLYDVAWFDRNKLLQDISPVVVPILINNGCYFA